MSTAIKYCLLALLFCVFASIMLSCKPQKEQKRKSITREMLLQHNKNLVDLENKVIRTYIDSCGLQMQQTKTGLWYGIESDSIGEAAQKRDIVHLNYVICLLDSTLCYSSEKNGIWSFEVGKGNVESGIEEGILLMSEGDKASFILPPNMAHGLSGDGDKIPGRAILHYHLELLKIERSDSRFQ